MMANITIEEVLKLLGEPLSDTGEGARSRFRQFIEEPQRTIDDYRAWITECITKGNRSEGRIYYNALQDLIVSIGKRLGFEVRYGRYTGSPSEVANDGCWISKDAFHILTEVKTSAWPVESVGQLGGYRQDYAQQNAISLEQIFGLYIIGTEEFAPLVDQIKGSDHRNVLRIISFERLLKLWQLKIDLEPIAGPDEAAAKVQKLLLPIESVNVGEFIDIIMEIATLRAASEEGEEENEEEEDRERDGGEPWDTGELRDYLADAKPYQKLLLGALALSDEEPIPRKRVIWLMQRIASAQPEFAGKQIVGGSIAGARSGLKMRRGAKEDIIVERNQTYSLKPDYKETIRNWVKEQGISLPPADDATPSALV